MTYAYTYGRPGITQPRSLMGARVKRGVYALGSDLTDCLAEPGADPDVCAALHPAPAEIEMPPMDVSRSSGSGAAAASSPAAAGLASLAAKTGISTSMLLVGAAASLGALYYFTRHPKRRTP